MPAILIKGETSCNREACQADFAPYEERGMPPWWNISTRRWYCPHCAVKINRACRDFKETICCFEKGSPEFEALPQQDKPW